MPGHVPEGKHSIPWIRVFQVQPQWQPVVVAMLMAGMANETSGRIFGNASGDFLWNSEVRGELTLHVSRRLESLRISSVLDPDLKIR